MIIPTANTVISSPAWGTLTRRSPAISGSRPATKNSVVSIKKVPTASKRGPKLPSRWSAASMNPVFRPVSMTAPRRRPVARAVLAALTIMVIAPLTLTGCTRSADPPPLPPHGVYDHEAAGETSRAEPVPANGTAGALTRPLTEAGWFCAQVRGNADGRSLWCRIGRRDETDTVVPQVAQFLLDREDRLAWAWFPAPAGKEDGQVAAAAASSLTAVWSGAGDRLREEIDDFDRDRRSDTVRRSGEIPRAGWRDEYADYNYSDLNGLVVTARDGSVRRWPFGAEHYATTMSSAVGDLLAGGYDCFYPPQESCNRPQSNGYFRVSLRGDQIVSAGFGIGSLIESGRQRHPLSQEFPHGLTFLTDAVRGAITERLEQCRRTGTGFTGIVAGSVVIIDASRGGVDDDDFAAYFHVQIGAPLAATLPV
ncbi:hypothetical protein [Microtetraspora niveoalba]|uniref:hypothetical protein n=1 Tax=Microtetraspora niveoalba TaxID=46175 RepID=UPI001FDFE8BC|nr:hypothetical protein [Microtetraspora niveoalba]